MVKLRTICKALYEGMKSLEMLCRTTTYQTDVNFAGEVDIRIMYHVKCFFQRVANAVGGTFSKVILGEALTILSSGNNNMTKFGLTGAAAPTLNGGPGPGLVPAPVPVHASLSQQQPQVAIPLVSLPTAPGGPNTKPLPIPLTTTTTKGKENKDSKESKETR
jgi:hypothetical protein